MIREVLRDGAQTDGARGQLRERFFAPERSNSPQNLLFSHRRAISQRHWQRRGKYLADWMAVVLGAPGQQRQRIGAEGGLGINDFERGAQLVSRHLGVLATFDHDADHASTTERHPNAIARSHGRSTLRRAIVEHLSQRSVDRHRQIWRPVSHGIPVAVLRAPHGLVYAQNLWTSLCIVWGEATQVLNPRT